MWKVKSSLFIVIAVLILSLVPVYVYASQVLVIGGQRMIMEDGVLVPAPEPEIDPRFLPPVTPNVPDPERDWGQIGIRFHNADFQVEVFEGVYWVPMRALGASRYTNEEIGTLANNSPHEKQEAVSTLFEAMQLYSATRQGIRRPEEAHLPVRLPEGVVHWNHHMPGYDAVRLNAEGGSARASWLNLILAGDYEETGFISYFFSNGTNRVINYIKHDGWYYFVDIRSFIGRPESGNLIDYPGISANASNTRIVKARTIECWVAYLLSVSNRTQQLGPLEAVFSIAADDFPPFAIRGAAPRGRTPGTRTIFWPSDNNITVNVIFDSDNDDLSFGGFAPVIQRADWSALANYVWEVDKS